MSDACLAHAPAHPEHRADGREASERLLSDDDHACDSRLDPVCMCVARRWVGILPCVFFFPCCLDSYPVSAQWCRRAILAVAATTTNGNNYNTTWHRGRPYTGTPANPCQLHIQDTIQQCSKHGNMQRTCNTQYTRNAHTTCHIVATCNKAS